MRRYAHLSAAAVLLAGTALALTAASHDAAPNGVTVIPAGMQSKAATRPAAAATNSVAPAFTASSTDFPNPERGFYRWIAPDYLADWSQDDANDAYSNGYRLLFARIDLSAYKDTDALPSDYIAKLNTAFGYARSAGVKLIVRAVYNYPNSETDESAGDAPLARIKSQIAQLKPTFQNNADVIAFVQAGFVGVWGEWHDSKNGFDDNAPAAQNWADVKDALLAAVPDTRFVQFRYPRHLMAWVPQSNLPTVAAAIQSKFRFGFHNDCFLSNATDVGTYNGSSATQDQQRSYTDQLGDLGPVGGETCDTTWDATAVRRSSCNDILTEGAKYNFTYLNISYWRPGFHDQWENNGCMPTVRLKMGYRLTLKSASHPGTITRGNTLNVSLGVQNDGWARVYNNHLVQIILQNTSTNASVRLAASGSDVRQWTPGSQPINMTLAAVVPSNLPAGQYRVLVAVVDASLPNDGRYAIRFGNDNNSAANQYWDSALAAFNLGTSLQVS